MRIFQLKQQQLSDLEEMPFKLEKEIQKLFEENLEQLTGLEFVKSEFSIQNQRIDTLAFDQETRSFVIIEYKRTHNYSVFDQGVSYLNTLLKYQSDFILEYNENLNKILKKNNIDWSQSKVVFVSPAFNAMQKQAVDFKDLNIELWEIRRFKNDIIMIDGIPKSSSAPSVKLSTTKNEQLAEVTKELKSYSESELVQKSSDEVIELYNDLKNALLNLSPSFTVSAQKFHVAFKKNKKNILCLIPHRKTLKIILNMKKGTLDDPKGIARDMSNIGSWGTGDYEIIIEDDTHLEYILSLVKQAL